MQIKDEICGEEGVRVPQKKLMSYHSLKNEWELTM